MRLLLTAFEPFGGEVVNPSARVLDALRSQLPRGVDGCLLTLPVKRSLACEVLLSAWDTGEFDLWVGLGQAGGAREVRVERVGRNAFSPTRSAHWRVANLQVERLLPDAPEAYVCRWPGGELAAALRAEGLPITSSSSAGSYVCNEVLFVMEHRMRTESPRAREAAPWAGFLHLPYLPEQLVNKPPDADALPLERQVCVVYRALEWLCEARAKSAHQPHQHAPEQHEPTQGR